MTNQLKYEDQCVTDLDITSLKDIINLDKVINKITITDTFVSKEFLRHILAVVTDEKLLLKLLCGTNSTFDYDFYILVSNKYYDMFTQRDKKNIENFKYNKCIHWKLKSHIMPTECLLKLVNINKFYLLNVDVDYKLQKELIGQKLNLIKYIKNPSKDLIIFAIKRCFKLLYYVNNIDNELFMEFIKSHDKTRIRKFYIWCKAFNYAIPTGRFRVFDFKGFIREYETVFPNHAVKV